MRPIKLFLGTLLYSSVAFAQIPTLTGPSVVCSGTCPTYTVSVMGGTWASSNPSVLSVGLGGVCGVGTGVATLSYAAGSGVATMTITVSPAVAAISGSSLVCSGQVIIMSDATPGGTWSSSNPSAATVNPYGVVYGAAAGSTDINYTLSAGCYATKPITVNTGPAYPYPAEVTCVGSVVALADATPGGVWSTSDASIVTVGSTGVATGISVGNAYISYTMPNGCFWAVAEPIGYAPPPISGPSTACAGALSASFDDPIAFGGGYWGNSTTTGISSGSPYTPVFGVGGGVATVTFYARYNSCYTTTTVSVLSAPAAISGPTHLCPGAMATLTDATPGGTWSSADPTIVSIGSASGVITATSSTAGGGTTISYTAGGCSTTASESVDFTTIYSGQRTLCVGSTITLNATPASGTWSSASPGVASVGSSSGIVSGVTNGVSIITYTTPSGCIATTTVTVVSTAPTGISGPTAICGLGTLLSFTSGLGGGTWSSSGVVSINPITGMGSAVSAGTAVITYSYGGTCGSSTLSFTANANPANITGTTSICVGGSAILSDATPGGSWISGASSIASITSAGSVSGLTTGTAIITYLLPTGCMTATTVSVVGMPAPITGPTSSCTGSNVTFTDATPGGGWSSTSGLLNVGSGSFYGLSAGAATVTYQTAAGCYATIPITVNATPSGISGTLTACPGGAPVTLTDATAGGTWSSSAPGTAAIGSSTGIVMGLSLGTALITYMTGGCAVFATFSVSPLSISGPTVICPSIGGALVGNRPGGTWTSSNPAVAVANTSGFVTGVSNGVATITYVAAGCMATHVVTVTTASPPAITGTTFSICPGASASLSDAMAGGSWSSSNTALVTIGAGSGIYTGVASGVATISYSVGCSYATATVTVSSFPPPITGGNTVCTGSTLALSDGLIGGTWISSSPSVATVSSSGVVTGVAAGTTVIVYDVTFGAYCYATETVSVGVTAPAIAGPSSVCTGNSITLSSPATGGTWSSSSSSIASVTSSGVVTGMAVGVATITYSIPGGCYGTQVVTVNPAPAPISGLASFCAGAPATYTDATPGGTWSSSNTSVIDIGSVTGVVMSSAVGTAIITYSLGGACVATLSATVPGVSPAVYNVTGGGGYCAGGTGVAVGLSGSQSGVSYTLLNGATAISTVGGTGSAVSIADTGSACALSMTGTATVAINPLPTAFTVTGGGSYCSGPGIAIGLSGSQAGVQYQLYLGTTAVGSTVVGTGAALSFGTFTTAGTYTAKATNTTTGCNNNMSGSATITIGPMPTSYSVTGGGSYCSGGAGVAVGLSNSQSGVTYQLYNSGAAVGSPFPGTGAAISFGMQTAAGTYTVTADAGTPCAMSMAGSATVTINPVATVYSVTGGGVYCAFGAGVYVGLSNSQTGVSYQLYRGGTAVGSVVAGTGSAIGFGTFTTAGTYTVVANPTLTCPVSMTGSATVTATTSTSLPAILTVGGGGSFCSGGAGVAVTLPGSSVGFNYQLYRSGVAAGSALPGIGTALSFGLQTMPGSYTVTATSTTTGCISNMTGSANVTMYPAPAVFTVTGGGAYCSGGSGVTIGLSGSASGISYRLYRGTTAVGSAMPGTGGAISFAYLTTAGAYTAVATNISTFCTANMAGSATVSVNPLPVISGSIYTVAPSSSITLTGSPTGGTWSSSVPAVATVGSVSGIVTGHALGTSTISYTVSTGCRSTHTVSVTATGHRGGIVAEGALQELTVLPNPNTGSFTIKGQVGEERDQSVSLEITNLLGQRLYATTALAEKGVLNKEIRLDDVAAGIYLLVVRTEQEQTVFRVVVR